MWAETGVAAFHTDKVFGRFRLVEFTLNSDGINLTLVAADSSPGVTGSGTAAGVNLTYEPGTDIFPMHPAVLGTAAITARYSAINVAAGTATLVLSAAPSNGGQLFVTLLVARSG